MAAAGCSSSGKAAPKTPSAKPVATYAQVTGTSSTLALDTTFVQAISSLQLTPGLIGSATLHIADLAFPITGGRLTVYSAGHKPALTGELQHAGSGLSFTGTGAKIALQDVVLHFGATSTLSGDVVVNGKTAFPAATLFDVDTTKFGAPTTKAGTTTIAGAAVFLDPAAAKKLDTALHSTTLEQAGKIRIGTLTVAATD